MILNNMTDFDAYKAELDQEAGCSTCHYNLPEKFPCEVYSEEWDSHDGNIEFFHYFD